MIPSQKRMYKSTPLTCAAIRSSCTGLDALVLVADRTLAGTLVAAGTVESRWVEAALTSGCVASPDIALQYCSCKQHTRKRLTPAAVVHKQQPSTNCGLQQCTNGRVFYPHDSDLRRHTNHL